MAKKKLDPIGEARKGIQRARKQLGEAEIASWDPPEPADCVTKAFYALENVVTAGILASGGRMTTKHYEKVDQARRLAKSAGLPDIGDQLRDLNDLRKDVSYSEPGPELAAMDLETLVMEVATYVDAMDRYIEAKAKAKAKTTPKAKRP